MAYQIQHMQAHGARATCFEHTNT
jgi:hypothetical protein